MIETKLAGDGVRAMVPAEKMTAAAKKRRDIYAMTPGAPLLRREFGYYCLDAWKKQGLPENADLAEIFSYDPPSSHGLRGLGWCEAAFLPAFEREIIEDRGDCEIERDFAGRHVLYFKGRRNGFMPEYVDHPVKDMRTWENDVKWRLNPDSKGRMDALKRDIPAAVAEAGRGLMIVQHVIGGYMYLRSLIGPETLLYAFYDMPELIHDCMKTWLELADRVTALHQQYLTFDEIFFGEDICYNRGPLISPEMMREFIIPYYQSLISSVKSRQQDKSRHLYVQIDTDGFADPVIPVYMETIGMDVMSPFEVASGCDVVELGRKYPSLVMTGGIDKRVLAGSADDIDRHLEYILPAMRARGGYIPTCDHGVPEEVPLNNYLHYRKRCLELGG
jgi:uroporphyrinogen decarboxylase